MTSLQARVSALSLAVGAGATVLLRFAPVELVPLMVLALGITTLGAWGFADEMGLRRPLNRAGFVAFSFAVGAKTFALVGGSTQAQSNFYVLYAFAALLALFLWSLALLHRDRQAKIAGALGTISALLPILLLIAGHVSVGIGAYWGVNVLYNATATELGSSPVIRNIDAIFLIWSLIAAALLWTGKITPPAVYAPQSGPA